MHLCCSSFKENECNLFVSRNSPPQIQRLSIFSIAIAIISVFLIMTNVLIDYPGVGPNGRPRYRLIKGDISRIYVDAMVLCTDRDMQQDLMVPLTAGPRVWAHMQWWDSTWAGGPPNSANAASATN